MIGRARKLGLCVALCGPLWWIGDAQAGAEVEPVRVMYEADAGCPGRTRFTEELLARTPKVAIADGTAKRTFVVTVRATASGFVGRLAIQAGEPTATTREITGPTCPAVVSAVALVAALAVDPDSLRGDAPVKADAVRDEPRPPAANAAPATSPVPPESLPSPPPPTKSRQMGWAVGLWGETNSFIAPQLSFGGGAFVELASRDDPDNQARGSLGLEALRLAFHYAATGTVQRDVGSAHFDWAAMSLEGCPAQVHGGGARLEGCAAFTGGVLRGHGDKTATPLALFEPQDPLRPWWSAALLVRVKWTLFGSWFLDADGSLVVPLRRDQFVFEQPSGPSTRVFYETPKVGGAAGIGIGYRFGDRAGDRRP